MFVREPQGTERGLVGEEGRKEGREEEREDGSQEARKDGRQDGRNQGRKTGWQDRRKEGRKEGRRKEARNEGRKQSDREGRQAGHLAAAGGRFAHSQNLPRETVNLHRGSLCLLHFRGRKFFRLLPAPSFCYSRADTTPRCSVSLFVVYQKHGAREHSKSLTGGTRGASHVANEVEWWTRSACA